MDQHILPPPPYSETDIYSSHPGSTSSHVDNVSVAGRSPSGGASSVGDPIYTPPYTPTGSEHHAFGEDHDLASVSSAHAYFESRPTFGRPSISTVLVHRMVLGSGTQPRDFPYPQPAPIWLAKDVTELDWNTFLNHLFPDHTTSVNNDVANRKLDIDLVDELMKRMNLGQANAQPDQSSRKSSSQLPNVNLAATIAEWNENFFEPRGVKIVVESGVPEQARATEENSGGRAAGARVSQEHELPHASGRRGVFAGFNPFIRDGTTRGFSFMVAADRHGVAMTSDRGRSFNPHEHQGHRGHHGHHGHHGWNRGGRGGRGYGRGRGRSQDHHRRRGRSSSSSGSSSSSSSSSDSEASLGSLPDFDNLKDQQLPVAKQSLIEWLNHPEQPMTRDLVSQMRQNIKTAKTSSPRNMDQDPKILRQEVKQLMKDFKAAKKTYKANNRAARREKRVLRKTARRERRETRREERRARKGKHREDGRSLLPFMATPPAPPHISPLPSIPLVNAGFGRMGFGRGGHPTHFPGRPGMSAMHAGWPFTRNNPYEPGSVAMPQPSDFPNAVSQSAENINLQAQKMEADARKKEDRATLLRAAATVPEISEKTKLKTLDEAAELEEEAENFRREADRLRAEALHLDEELARELHDQHDTEQWSGIVHA